MFFFYGVGYCASWQLLHVQRPVSMSVVVWHTSHSSLFFLASVPQLAQETESTAFVEDAIDPIYLFLAYPSIH
jgi:hypothetical protein